ncbi:MULTISPECIES: MFS transporter [unclassified Exiguobacterium]|uniref:MFS transporter n=1 Tax=unclassified Exiguobacterium TaxID=2644629 RepID=UPI00103A82BF|nr:MULTISPECIES: MFS transporter [unclassified Exiguobacterium]TCI36588.1 MFS transporter [Exiguobacterium sp. SH4S7]TCI48640.1 MFS transporter [Exiguobacterium sp. SH5S32]TCI55526.1 MFS transporter [Exiguobacterium sp. SH1S4]TCI75323.1 MFS transporter [Exiguobacterium sp. SH1S1]
MKIQQLYYMVTSSRSLVIQMVFTLNAIYYVTTAELNALQLVLIGTILEVSIFLFELPTGLVADLYGRKRSIVIGTGLIGLAHLLEGGIPEFWAIAIASSLWGIGWTFISGAEQAWIADEMGNQELEQVFLRGAQYSSLGRFIGIGIAVLFAEMTSVQTTIVVAGGLLIGLALLIWKVIPETRFEPITRAGTSNLLQAKQTVAEGYAHIRGNAILVGLAAITLVWGLASEGFDRLWGAHLIDTFRLSEQAAIYWFGLFYAVAFLLNMLVLKGVETYIKGRYATTLFWFNVLLILTMLAFAWVGQFFVAVLLYWTIAALRNVHYPLMSVMTNERLPSKGRATILSMFGQVDAFGQVAGGPLIGLVALYTSIQGGLGVSALLLLPMLYFLRRIKHH